MELITLNTEMIVVLCLLGVTIFLFVSEIIRVDLAAILMLVVLGLLSFVPGMQNLVEINHLFDGFASNAVISIIAVMIIGAGLDKTGLMNKVASLILQYGGSTEKRIIPIISGTVGIISSFMQNVGAAALFVPVVSRISVRTELPLSRLLMPMGFCAIMGGTITMVGSSPLILLNDLIGNINKDLPQAQQIAPFGLFSVTPIGLALVTTGILYFVILGRWVLPKGKKSKNAASGQSVKDFVKKTYGLKSDILELKIPANHELDGKTLDYISEKYHVYIIGTDHRGQRVFEPSLSNKLQTPCRLAVLGRHKVIQHMAITEDFTILPKLDVFSEDFAATKSGVAEVVVPPGSSLIGKHAYDLQFRNRYRASLLAISRTGETLSLVETDDHIPTAIPKVPFQAGDTLVLHTSWEALTKLTQDRDFVVVTTDFPRELLRPKKVGWAVLFFAIALSLILFTNILLSLCLLVGAVGMIIAKVIDIDEAYEAVSWSTVFLLASLIPLGQAVQNTGTAQWIAQEFLSILDGWPIWALQTCVAILATIFTLIMSNVGATVLLVPLAVSIAIAAGGDPALFALTVAISTSNSFLIPTHQVNALIMGPAGYQVKDFIKTGGLMTVLFLIVSLVMMNLIF